MAWKQEKHCGKICRQACTHTWTCIECKNTQLRNGRAKNGLWMKLQENQNASINGDVFSIVFFVIFINSINIFLACLYYYNKTYTVSGIQAIHFHNTRCQKCKVKVSIDWLFFQRFDFLPGRLNLPIVSLNEPRVSQCHCKKEHYFCLALFL